MAKKSPLGRGLGALIDNSKYEKKPVKEAISTNAVAEINISDIVKNPFQPRKEFNRDTLIELSESIKEFGVIQPVTVRKLENNKFQLISGERRFRACKMAGLKKIIAFVRKADDQEMLEMAIVENIQREDLNAIEIAVSYQRLMDECQLTQDKLSERVGKKRSTITNYLRLLKLPAEIQAGIQDKQISMGHARALINIEDAKKAVEVYYKIVSDGLSVRNSEKIIREINYPVNKESQKTKRIRLPEKFTNFKKDISVLFPSNVDIKRSNSGKGSLVISFKSDDEFEKIKSLLSKLKTTNEN